MKDYPSPYDVQCTDGGNRHSIQIVRGTCDHCGRRFWDTDNHYRRHINTAVRGAFRRIRAQSV
jgi:hypothetical protein